MPATAQSRPGSAGNCSALSTIPACRCNEPLPVIAAGLAGGFAYWAVAGWSAGFWKPVFRREPTGGGDAGHADAATPR